MEYPFTNPDFTAAVALATARVNSGSRLPFAEELAHAALDLAESNHRLRTGEKSGRDRLAPQGVTIERGGRSIIVRIHPGHLSHT